MDRANFPVHELEPRTIRADVLRQWCTAESRRARARATPTRSVEPITAFWLAALVGKKTFSPTTRFSMWTRLPRREVRASRRLYAGSRFCSGDLWRAWRIRDCRTTWCSENLWGARAAWEAGKRVHEVFLVGQPQSFRYQRRPVDDCSPGRGGMAQDAEQGAERFMAKWIAAGKDQG